MHISLSHRLNRALGPGRVCTSTALVVLVLLASGSLWAQANSTQRVFQPINFPVRIDDRSAGSIRAIPPAGENPLRISVEDLSAALSDTITAEVMQSLGQLPVDEGLVTAGDLAAIGIRTRFDDQDLVIRLDFDIEARPVERLVAGPSLRVYQDALEPADFSAYLNTALSTQLFASSAVPGISLPVSVSINPVVRLAGHVIEASFTTGFDRQWFFHPGYVRYVYDFQDAATRMTIGDTIYHTLGFQSYVPIQGVSIYRESLLDPSASYTPEYDQRIIITEPSEVTIRINGRVVQETRLSPGRYDVTEFPLARGVNDVEIDIEGPDGQVATHTFQTGYASNLLRKGAHDFSYALGIPPYTAALPWILGYHRVGVSSRMVLGATIQTNILSQMLGLHMLWATQGGEIQADAGVSRSLDNVFDAAASLRYQIRLNTNLQFPVLGLVLDYMGPEFITFGLRKEGFPLGARLTASFRLGSSVSAHISTYAAVDQTFSSVLPGCSLSLGTFFGQATTAQFRANLAISPEGEPDWEATLRLSSAPNDRAISTSVAYDLRTTGTGLSVQLPASKPARSLGLTAQLSGFASDPSNGASALLAGHYKGYRFESSFAERYAQSPDGDHQWTTTLQIGTGIAYVDSSLGFTRPIGGSFAIVDRHPKYRNMIVGVNSAQDGYEALADDFGPAIVPSLPSYIPTRVYVESNELPVGYDLGETTYLLLPEYRSGHRIQVGSPGVVFVSGTLLLPDGNEAALVTGTMASDTLDEPQPFFTNRSGVFQLYELEPGEYTLTITGSQSVTFVIEPNVEGEIELGEARLMAKPDSLPIRTGGDGESSGGVR
jgi:outer membrane usher protein